MVDRRGTAAAGLVLVVSAFATSLNAAQPELEEVIVTATGQSTASSTTKTDTPLIETPQSISVITREEMDVRAVATVADALSYSAGVQAEAAGIDSRVDEVSVRGFGAGGFSSNNNFVDGLRLPSGGQWTRSAFDPFGLQQIDVLKGPSGALYGQTAPGGLVNLVTKRPTFTPHGEFMLQSLGYTDLGRWQYQAAGDISGPLADNVAYRFVGMARDGETQIDQTSNSRYYAAPSLTWQPGDDTTWTLLGQYQRDRGGSTYQFLPATGTLRASNGRRIELDEYLGEPDWNRFDRDQQLIASLFEHRFNDVFTLRNNVRYTHIESLYRVTVLSGDTVTNCAAPPLIAGCISGQTIRRRAVQGVGESDGYAIDTQLEARFSTGAIQHTLLGGVDYFHTEWEHYRDSVAPALVLPLLDIYNPVARGSARYTSALVPAIYTETTSKQTGFYLQDQLEAGRLRITLGGRHDSAKDDALDTLDQTSTLTDADAFTGRIGGVYLFDNGFAPYLSYSESFQPASGAFYDGRPFDPTTGEQFEAGIRYQPPGSNAFLTLGAYEITQQNIATPDPDSTHICDGGSCQVQTGEGRVRGIELEGRATLPFGMAVILTATRSDGEVTKSNFAGERGNTLAQVPDTMASLFVDYRFQGGPLEGFGLGGGVRYTGESYGNIANTLEIPDYTLFDLFARYDFRGVGGSEGLSLSANVRNLTNETYVATCGSVAACYYGSGRTLSLRAQYRW